MMTQLKISLSSTSPQLMPGMSLSVCICLYCLPKMIAALDRPAGELLLRFDGDAAMVLGLGGEAMVAALKGADAVVELPLLV